MVQHGAYLFSWAVRVFAGMTTAGFGDVLEQHSLEPGHQRRGSGFDHVPLSKCIVAAVQGGRNRSELQYCWTQMDEPHLLLHTWSQCTYLRYQYGSRTAESRSSVLA